MTIRVVVKLSDAPNMDGCRWCGASPGVHLRRREHAYERPTRAQYDARLAAVEEGPNPGAYRVPLGLCANRDGHVPHLYRSASLGLFYCHANQARRQPRAAEQRARVLVDKLRRSV